MTKTKWYPAAALAALVLCAAGWTTYAQRQDAQRPAWEYKTVYASVTELHHLPSFKNHGEQGWELATAVSVEGGGAYFTFKRQK